MAKHLEPKTRRTAVRLAYAAGAAVILASGPALAQQSVSRPVVQAAAPTASLNELNAALKVLSRDQRNLPALLRAGWASLGLDDTQAALGFFRRAEALQPQNGEVKAGLASASLHQGDPVAAVRLFAEAEAAGAPMARYAAERGLALDLVGNNAGAQQLYKQALAQGNDPETVRRLALSQAIAGDQASSEATLLPLLVHQDLAAYRTRAFALAILGKGEEAVSIAQTMLPATISGRLAPYLRYMPRLTRAQQAAAANLGQFPPASEIGRDSPAVAAYSGNAPGVAQVAAATPDSRLVPSGEPLGASEKAASNRRTASRTERTRSREPKVKGKGDIEVSYTPIAQAAPAPAPAVRQAAPPPATPIPQVQPPPARVAALTVQPSVAQPVESKPVLVSSVDSQAAAPANPPAPADKPVLVASVDPQPSTAPPPPPIEEAAKPSLSISAPPPQPEPQPASLAEAFADFAKPTGASVAATGEAVDISRIKPAREAAKPAAAKPDARDESKADAAKSKAKAKPKPPANPSRFWVQVGTGRDVKALAFTWRKLQKEGGALLAKHDAYSAKWGATRRLLTGPYKTEAEADKAVAALKKKGFDAFEFTSDEGEDVSALK